MKLSKWQDGVPPSVGIWEIDVPEHDDTYYCRYKDGTWGIGQRTLDIHINSEHVPYPSNNDPSNPRKWRGQIEE